MAVFKFKGFEVDDHGCGMKICSDSVLLGAWFFKRHRDAQSILDIGAGSGVLSLIGASICRHASVVAVEIDKSAACACEKNFAEFTLNGHLKVIHSDFADYCPGEKVELIVSNPPYFSEGHASADNSRALARHQQGLSYGSLMKYAAKNLAARGALGFVAPAELEDDLIFQAELAGLKINGICRVRTSPRKAPTRVLIECGMSDESSTAIQTLTLGTPEYLDLVQDLYLKM